MLCVKLMHKETNDFEDFYLPMSGEALQFKLDIMDAMNDLEDSMKVLAGFWRTDSLTDPKQVVLPGLDGSDVNPYTLNYFAQWINSLSLQDRTKFEALCFTKPQSDLQGLFGHLHNLHRYVLVQDLSDIENNRAQISVDKEWVVAGEPWNEEKYDMKMVEILSLPDKVVTEYGLLVGPFTKPEPVLWPILLEPLESNHPIFKVYSPGLTESVTSLHLPVEEPELENILARIKHHYPDYTFTAPPELSRWVDDENLYFKPKEWNELASCLASCDEKQLANLKRAANVVSADTPDQIYLLRHSIHQFKLIQDVHTPEELGKTLAKNALHSHRYKDVLPFVDTKALGVSTILNERGVFLPEGYFFTTDRDFQALFPDPKESLWYEEYTAEQSREEETCETNDWEPEVGR